MSSAVYITFKEPVLSRDWLPFCTRCGIEHSPRTVGGNVFYDGQIEVTFGECDLSAKPPVASPVSASKVVVSSFWGSNLEHIALVAGKIAKQFDVATLTCDPELSRYVAGIMDE